MLGVGLNPVAVEAGQAVGIGVPGWVGVVQGCEFERKHRVLHRQGQRGRRRHGPGQLDAVAALGALERAVEHAHVGDGHLWRDRAALHLAGMHGRHAAHAAKVERAVRRGVGGGHGEAFGQAIGGGEVGHAPGVGVKPGQAGRGADPQHAGRVGAHRQHLGVADTVLEGEAAETDMAIDSGDHFVEALGGAGPDAALGIFEQGRYIVVAEGIGVAGHVVEVGELAAGRVEQVESAAIPFRAHPDAPFAVFDDGGSAGDAARGGVVRIVDEELARARTRVVAHHVAPGAQPQRAAAAGADGVDEVGGDIVEVDDGKFAVRLVEPVQAGRGAHPQRAFRLLDLWRHEAVAVEIQWHD